MEGKSKQSTNPTLVANRKKKFMKRNRSRMKDNMLLCMFSFALFSGFQLLSNVNSILNTHFSTHITLCLDRAVTFASTFFLNPFHAFRQESLNFSSSIFYIFSDEVCRNFEKIQNFFEELTKNSLSPNRSTVFSAQCCVFSS